MMKEQDQMQKFVDVALALNRAGLGTWRAVAIDPSGDVLMLSERWPEIGDRGRWWSWTA